MVARTLLDVPDVGGVWTARLHEPRGTADRDHRRLHHRLSGDLFAEFAAAFA
jgi:hypothetical protein